RGKATACPTACPRSSLAKRVKSGMLRETVDQKPTVPFSAGIRNFRKSLVLRNCEGVESIGPKPPALFHAHINSRTPTPNRIGALRLGRKGMNSMLFRITARLMAQKIMKQIAVPFGFDRHAGHTVPSRVLMASPPIQLWMPNQPHATRARNTAAT